MSAHLPNTVPDSMDSAHDEARKRRRRLLILTPILFMICGAAGAGGIYAVMSQGDKKVQMEEYRGQEQPDEELQPPSTEPPAENPTAAPTMQPTAELTELPSGETNQPLTTEPNAGPATLPFDLPEVLPPLIMSLMPPPSGASGDACAQNGGLQWQGDICACSGVIDHVTICMDGSKTDTLTNTSCVPQPQDCPAPPPTSEGPGTGEGPLCFCECSDWACPPETYPEGCYCSGGWYDTCTLQPCIP